MQDHKNKKLIWVLVNIQCTYGHVYLTSFTSFSFGRKLSFLEHLDNYYKFTPTNSFVGQSVLSSWAHKPNRNRGLS